MPKITHVQLPGSYRSKDPTAFRVGDVNPKEKIIVTIGLKGPKLPGPGEHIGHTFTPDQIAEKFSVEKTDAVKVTETLKNYGLKVLEISLVTRSMRLIGTAENMEAAFKPDWAVMSSCRQPRYRGRQGVLYIPEKLKGIVTGVFGLDQRQMAHRRTGLKGPTNISSVLESPFTPKDIIRQYNFPSGDGLGETIAIAAFAGGYFAEDMDAYFVRVFRSQGQNIPTPGVKTISVNAPAYTLQEILSLPIPEQIINQISYSFEVMTDTELIAGLCPKANIVVYFSTFDEGGWIGLLDRIFNDAKQSHRVQKPIPVALSISWGLPEDYWTKNQRDQINDQLNRLSLLGITTCVASGDDGSRGYIQDGQAHVDFPSSSPFVLSVGGTMLKANIRNNPIIGNPIIRVQEVVWWETWTDPLRISYVSTTGGGVSTKNLRPNWQDGPLVTPLRQQPLNPLAFDGRVVPDVAALAGKPYYDLIFLGLPVKTGATSASAPVWAALIARINAKLPQNRQGRFLTPLLYQKLPPPDGRVVGQVSCRDITQGDNTPDYPPPNGYKAGIGFDKVTGWGVPDGMKLLDCLNQVIP